MCFAMKFALAEAFQGELFLPTTEPPLMIRERRTFWRRRATGEWYISVKGQGCACSMLSDDADWGKEQWDIRSSHVQAIADAVMSVALQVNAPFAFIAGWDGDECHQAIAVTPEQLKNVILTGKIAQNARYEVSLSEESRHDTSP